MWRYSTVVFVLLFTIFANGQEQCLQLTTAPCDGQHPVPIPSGPKGDKGDNYDSSFRWEMDRNINVIKRAVIQAKRHMDSPNTLETIQSRLISLERQRPRMELRRTPRKGNLDEAHRMCNDMGGALLQRCLFNDVQGHNYKDEIYNFVRGEEHWIGATDRAREGSWKFLNGDPFPATTSDLIVNWNAGEPDNWKGAGRTGEDCSQIFILRNGVMVINDLPCASRRYGICEL